MEDGQIHEAAETVFQIAGWSAYLHGIDYDLEQYLQELDAAVKHITSQFG